MKRLFKNWKKHLKHVQSVDEFKNSKLQKKKKSFNVDRRFK